MPNLHAYYLSCIHALIFLQQKKKTKVTWDSAHTSNSPLIEMLWKARHYYNKPTDFVFEGFYFAINFLVSLGWYMIKKQQLFLWYIGDQREPMMEVLPVSGFCVVKSIVSDQKLDHIALKHISNYFL